MDLLQQLNSVSTLQDAWNETRDQLRKHQRELGALRLEHDGQSSCLVQQLVLLHSYEQMMTIAFTRPLLL